MTRLLVSASMTNVRSSNFAGMACSVSIRSKTVALAGSGRTGQSGRQRKAARDQRARTRALDYHGANGGGICGRWERIDTAEAVDVSYPGFFREMAGGEDAGGMKGAR